MNEKRPRAFWNGLLPFGESVAGREYLRLMARQLGLPPPPEDSACFTTDDTAQRKILRTRGRTPRLPSQFADSSTSGRRR
jgi:hypothetical protein